MWTSELQEAANFQGYRGYNGEADGWLFFRSQEGVPGEIALAVGSGEDGAPWLLAIDHPGVVAAFDASPAEPPPGRFAAAYAFASRAELDAAIRRVFHLARSVPDHPLREFERETAHLGDTEGDQLIRRRKGQDRFRDALMDYWEGRCPLTGITERALLRASHIVAWADCETDFQRLDANNGILLAAHYDAAFDCGLISFGPDGRILFANGLSEQVVALLATDNTVTPLSDGHRRHLVCHRKKYGFQ